MPVLFCFGAVQIAVCRANRNNDMRPVGAHDITPAV